MADVGLEDAPRARAMAHTHILSVRALGRAGRTFIAAVAVAFLTTVGLGAISPTWALAIADAVQRLYLGPGHFLAQYLSTQVTITLANSLAALGAALLGAWGALLVARIQLGDASAGRTHGALGRASYVLMSWLCAAARRCVPELGAAREMDARTAAAIAVLVPRLSIVCSGCMLGIYLAGALLTGWTAHLLRDAAGLLPHGVCEVPAMIVSGAVGICIAERLVAAAHGGLRDVHDTAARTFSSPRLLRILGLLIAAIIIGAAIEVRTM